MNGGPVYRHVQRGDALRMFLLVVAAAILVVTVVILRNSDPAHVAGILIFGTCVLLISGVVFTQLTIEVTATELRWYFGFGLPSGRIARGDLIGATMANPGLLNGIGIHLTLRGWLWNVSLGTAVEMKRRSGADVLLGTDDPDGLIAALGLRGASDPDA